MISLKFESQIKVVAETYYQIYEEMTGHSVREITFDKIDSPYAIEGFKKAIVIPYENEKENFEGRFVLGISDETMAVKLAAGIAENAGMPAVERMDDTATDILFEFMNTVVGKVITVWDKMGLTADFSPPEFVSDLQFNNQQSDDLAVYTITLKLRDNEKVIITVSSEKTKKSILEDKKVLVVDDSKMIRHLLTKEFEKQGCQVSEAVNGLDGFIKTHAIQPHLIIMDLIMPKMGGLEAIDRIRELYTSVHIIILTSTSKKEEVIAAAQQKIKGFVRKPIQMDHLLKLARSCFK
jgi:CheY-like chemotaxis protein/CheY-specific phosphatase CheX